LNSYKLTVEYCGTNYLGFQVQSVGKTIQGELINAAKLISKSEEVKTIGSGRTDSGVHAIGQIVKLEMPLEMNPNSLVMALNTKLPRDIRVKKAELCSADFHPIYSAKTKEYNYVFSTSRIPSVFGKDLMANFDFEFDEEKMSAACRAFIGKYDFSNYQCVGTDIESTVREINLCELQKHVGTGHWAHVYEEYYVIRVVGNGFLKQMVRLMVGAIWNAGRGKISIADILSSLQNPVQKKLGAVAPPEGLYLVEVHY
jgi:tRNA pseudouridine38-40 synthase